MNFIDSIRADRYIAQVRDEADPKSPGAKKAFSKLKKLGTSAVPKVLEELATADKRQSVEYVELLSQLANDKTLPMITRGLADPNPRTVSATAWALSTARGYNVNRLLDLLGEDEYSKSAVIEILTAHKDRLNTNQLLTQIYNLQPAEKTAVFKLIDETMTPALIPDLLSRLDGKDPHVKMHLLNTMSRFDLPEVRQALASNLKDASKLVRQAALAGIANMKGAADVDQVCALLLDPDIDVINKAVDVVIQLNHPDTVKYLIPAMKDENEFSRRAAVEVLNEIGNANSIKILLEAVSDEDWWVRSRASDALAKIGGERVLNAVMELIGDKDENIRRAAIEILCACGDRTTVDRLIQATADPDWWVSERAADALAGLGDARAVPALLAMLERKEQSSVAVALTALAQLGDNRLLDKVLPFLHRPEKEIKVAAIDAVARLANDDHAEAVRAHLEKTMSGEDDTISRAASKAIQQLDDRQLSGGYSGVATAAPATSGARTGGAAGTRMGTAAGARTGPTPTAPAAPAPPASSSTTRTLLVDDAEIEDIPPEKQLLDISTLQPGDVIEQRYKFVQKIGKGAFGTVLLVEDTVVDERLILKFLNPNVASDDEMMKRFVHELRYSRRITHKNVIRIYDFLYIGGGYAISMEYFPSHTLGTEIANDKPMDPRKAVRFAIDICTGMQIAHQQGIIHRDLKPANILINDEGLLKIVDFGVAAAAKSGDTQLTKTGYVIGSPKYMAPEQILGKKVDERADIYSLGVILYEMLAGTPPYSRGDHMAVMYQHVQGKAAPLAEAKPDLPKELCDIVTKTMMVDKSKRYGSMDEVCEALTEAANNLAAVTADG